MQATLPATECVNLSSESILAVCEGGVPTVTAHTGAGCSGVATRIPASSGQCLPTLGGSFLVQCVDAADGSASPQWARLGHDKMHTGRSGYVGPTVTPGIAWSAFTGTVTLSSPAIGPDGTVFIGGPVVRALAPKNGAVLWQFPSPSGGTFQSSPALSDDCLLFIGGTDTYVYALNCTSGAQVWSFATGRGVRSSPAVADGVVYVGSGDNSLYALSAATGNMLWQFITSGSVDSSPAIAGGVVYVGSNDFNLYAFNASTGDNLWVHNVRNLVPGSPAVGANGMVYIGSVDGHVYGVWAASGQRAWLANTTGPGAVQSSPALGPDGTVYIGSDDSHLYALNGSTGSVLWAFRAAGAVVTWVRTSPLVDAAGNVYLASNSGFAYGLHGTTGALLWSTPLGSFLSSSPALSASGDIVCALEDGGRVLALSTGVAPTPSPRPSESKNDDRVIVPVVLGTLAVCAGVLVWSHRRRVAAASSSAIKAGESTPLLSRPAVRASAAAPPSPPGPASADKPRELKDVETL